MGEARLRGHHTQNIPVMNEVRNICVYCASSSKIDKAYSEAAYRLGRLMAGQGITLVNGAGNMGLMRACADGCMEAGGKAIGVIPSFMIAEGWCHDGMTQIIETTDIHTRQEKMAEMSDAAIFLPGGCGTLAELTELIAWKQLGLYLKPMVILNTQGYFNPMLEVLRQAIDQNFMRLQHAGIWQVAETPDEALRLAATIPLWDKDVRRFAAT